MSDPQAPAPEASSVLTVDFYQNPHRRGIVPSPEGVLPSRRRQRRSMVNLAAWDQQVAIDNARRAGETPPAPVPFPTPAQLDPTSTADPVLAQAAGQTAGEPLGIQTPPELAAAATTRPRDPDDEEEVVSTKRTPTLRGALVEDSQPIRKNQGIELPGPPTMAGIEEAKALLAREEAEILDDEEDDEPEPEQEGRQDAQDGPGATDGTTGAQDNQPQPSAPPEPGPGLVPDAPAFIPPPPPETTGKPAAKSTRNRR